MKTVSILVLALALTLVMPFSCKEPQIDATQILNDDISVSENDTAVKEYPVSLLEIFKAHGGLNQWNEMKNLCFEISKNKEDEIHTIALPDRRTVIVSKGWSIGFDGGDVWLSEKEENTYNGDPVFYHNLMFYFSAMPFVLADTGIEYSEVKATEIDGTVFEGVKIRFEQDVGYSPKDEYIVYYEPESYQMAWLAYTVTKGSDSTSSDWHYVKYDEWQQISGLTVPKRLTWYTVENNKPIKARNSVVFEKTSLTETMLDDVVFKRPEGAEVVANSR